MDKPLSERDAALLLDMLMAARDARHFVADIDENAFLSSRLHQNAVIRSLQVIGEAASKVSGDFRKTHPEISWREIIGMRHRLVHGYAEVRLDLVQIGEGHPPTAEEVLEAMRKWIEAATARRNERQ